MAKSGRRVGRTPPPRSLSEDSRNKELWWWIGAAAVVLLIAAGAVYWFTRPGEAPVSPTPTSAPTATAAASDEATPGGTFDVTPTTGAETSEESSEEASSMPENPQDRNEMYSQPPDMQIDPAKAYQATIATEKGDIVVELDAEAAPQTVNNFVFLAREGFYDGLTFHRVVPGFVIQGGDPLGSGRGGSGYTVEEEIGLEHVKGAIAMARRGDQVNPEKASSGSQFYITLEATPNLDGGYTVFGNVVEGTDVVESIAEGDVIESVIIEESS